MKALFLDRDGVINIEKEGSYIFSKKEFVPLAGALEAIGIARHFFDRIIVVTNQRGIGRGLMTETDLASIHDHLQDLLTPYHTSIDAFYFARGLDDDDPFRKPNIGMGLQAQRDFPSIDLNKSTMIGNNRSDMLFGKNLGMKTVFLYTTSPPQQVPNEHIDEQFASLLDWARELKH